MSNFFNEGCYFIQYEIIINNDTYFPVEHTPWTIGKMKKFSFKFLYNKHLTNYVAIFFLYRTSKIKLLMLQPDIIVTDITLQLTL